MNSGMPSQITRRVCSIGPPFALPCSERVKGDCRPFQLPSSGLQGPFPRACQPTHRGAPLRSLQAPQSLLVGSGPGKSLKFADRVRH
jgi:hypothetical protein